MIFLFSFEVEPPMSPLASDGYRVETSYQGGMRESTVLGLLPASCRYFFFGFWVSNWIFGGWMRVFGGFWGFCNFCFCGGVRVGNDLFNFLKKWKIKDCTQAR